MGPAIALRLRQHLTLTPQVQQALRLLQMSALEFAQEMDQALTANPFLEENSETPSAPRETSPSTSSSIDDVVVPQEAASPGVSDREQEDWSSVSDLQPTLREHLREQLMISQMGERDRALAHMIIDSLDDDGYFKLEFEELMDQVHSQETRAARHANAPAAPVSGLWLPHDRSSVRTLDQFLPGQYIPHPVCLVCLVRRRGEESLAVRAKMHAHHRFAMR